MFRKQPWQSSFAEHFCSFPGYCLFSSHFCPFPGHCLSQGIAFPKALPFLKTHAFKCSSLLRSFLHLLALVSRPNSYSQFILCTSVLIDLAKAKRRWTEKKILETFCTFFIAKAASKSVSFQLARINSLPFLGSFQSLLPCIVTCFLHILDHFDHFQNSLGCSLLLLSSGHSAPLHLPLLQRNC